MKAATIGIALAIGCAQAALGSERAAPGQFDGVIAKHSAATGVPETLIRRVIVRESKYNPRAYNRGHYGMMQIKPATARSMGYRGAPTGLLDADVNLTYAVRYLAGAYKVAGGDHDRAVRLYASGYYYDAKRRGMLAAIGMGRDGRLTPPAAAQTAAVAPATASAPVQLAALPSPAKPAVPVPPVRGAAAAPTVPAPAVLAAGVPLPTARDAARAQTIASAGAEPAKPAVRTIDPKAAPTAFAAVVPTPQPRDAQIVTGSVAPRAAPRPALPASASATITTAAAVPASPGSRVPLPAQRPRVVAVDTPPALAAAGPVGRAAPLPPKR